MRQEMNLHGRDVQVEFEADFVAFALLELPGPSSSVPDFSKLLVAAQLATLLLPE